MYLGSYEFDGDPATLLAAYDRLAGQFPPGVLPLHVCVVRDGGITVYDACPSRTDFEEFSQGAQFAGAVAAAGLPGYRAAGIGEVHGFRVQDQAGGREVRG